MSKCCAQGNPRDQAIKKSNFLYQTTLLKKHIFKFKIFSFFVEHNIKIFDEG